jgi:integrase
MADDNNANDAQAHDRPPRPNPVLNMSSDGLKIVDGLKGSRSRERKRRTVYLLPDAVASLKAHRRRYLEERMLRAERWEETWYENPKARDLVFPSTTGGPMNRNNLLKRHFKPLARVAGLPKEATLYTLRHTFATLWLESGENPKIRQEILGHFPLLSQRIDGYSSLGLPLASCRIG